MGRVKVSGLCKSYRERRRTPRRTDPPVVKCGDPLAVLDDVELEVADGELVCVLGPSGCGKSTFLRILAGFEPATSGSVVIDGADVVGPSPDNIFVFQHGGLLPWMTVQENIGLGVRRERDRAARSRRVAEFIDLVELSGFEHLYPHQLSGGMQRRAELARALVVNPEILFMDEPFAGLDFFTRLRMREEIVNMHELFQKTLIFITHDIDEALMMADKLIIFSDRPARVKLDQVLDFPHPRDPASTPELGALRRRLYRSLGVHYAL